LKPIIFAGPASWRLRTNSTGTSTTSCGISGASPVLTFNPSPCSRPPFCTP
jgi:hypothetical protein